MTKEIEREERLTTSLGMVPLRLLLDKFQTSNLWQFPRLGGMPPSNLFSSMKSLVNIVMLPREDEINPEILLPFVRA